MDDRMSVELVDGGDDALLEFLFRSDSDVFLFRSWPESQATFSPIQPPSAFLERDG
jgi:hypothetical protein